MKLLKVAGGGGGVCLPKAMSGLVGSLMWEPEHPISKKTRSGRPMRGWHSPGSCAPEQGPQKQLWEGLEGVPRSRQVPQEQKWAVRYHPPRRDPCVGSWASISVTVSPTGTSSVPGLLGSWEHHDDKVTGTSSQVGVGSRVGDLTADKYEIKIHNKCQQGKMRTQREGVG